MINLGYAALDLGHWLDEIDTSLAVDEIARTEKHIEDINTQILELARLVTEPHPLWPGGWLIEEIGQDDPARRWRSPWAPWDTVSFAPGARRTAWRTQAAAEAAVPVEHAERYRVVWSPMGRTGFSEYLNTPLDAASLDAIGNPRVRVHDASAGYSPWLNTGRPQRGRARDRPAQPGGRGTGRPVCTGIRRPTRAGGGGSAVATPQPLVGSCGVLQPWGA